MVSGRWGRRGTHIRWSGKMMVEGEKDKYNIFEKILYIFFVLIFYASSVASLLIG